MSGDHNQYQKDKSYLDGMDRYKQVRELVKDPSLKIKDIVELTGYDKGHVSRLRKASQQFECPRCGHCCQADQLTQQQEPVAWMHNVIEGNVITHIPADIGRHPERWTALYKDPTPCKTCESLAMAVMNDQTYHEKVIPKREWVGLTDQEIGEVISGQFAKRNYWVKITKALESKLKEKNT